jgi:choline kinase
VPQPVQHAVILAAGIGSRLQSVVPDRPKGLIEIQGETLVGRSVRLLREAGIRRITMVVGYRAEDYERFAAGEPDVCLVRNDAFATAGSMASLAVGLDGVEEPVLVLESDIVYEARALGVLMAGPDTATLLSGPTRAGDEVWVYAPGGTLRSMSKAARDLPDVTGEFVGITRVSREAAAAMRDAFAQFTARHGHGQMDYETGALVEVARRHPVAALLVPDLCWGEIDDDRQLARVERDVWPRLAFFICVAQGFSPAFFAALKDCATTAI